ncbi:ankyrin repeat domain-containing protein [Pochonia chlamydosporia 170]|uniref:Ankyrin repeat domain-containing protein n=1 Tax=Pochonia chlamydosporia 170 TaxID=1380566 RepID=A0A179EYX3_METCM|nr:ankyrin repeat domain-containing protein [Pochonia chlamydosporia 170]OAQ58099.1 ankyrin repeat domain-containing protein [Pochonia chlamydosporia 170]
MEENSFAFFTGLSLELILMIFRQLDWPDIASLAVVNQWFNNVIESHILYHPEEFGYALAYGVQVNNVATIRKVLRFGGSLVQDLGEASAICPQTATPFLAADEEDDFKRIRRSWTYDEISNTALGLATFQGNADMIRELLELGADPYHYASVDRLGPWHYVLKKAPPQTAPRLAAEFLRSNRIDTNKILPDGLLPLHLAVDSRLNSVFEMLVDTYFADINLTAGAASETALLRAVSKRHTLLIDFLLREPGIKVNCTDHNGQSALILAVIQGNSRVVERLLSKGVDANHKDKWGQSALTWAVILNIQEVLEPLLDDSRVDLNTQNTSGMTPLSIASWYGDYYMATQLLQYQDIDVHLQNENGETALSIAKSWRVVLKGGANWSEPPKPGFVARDDIGRNSYKESYDEIVAIINKYVG